MSQASTPTPEPGSTRESILRACHALFSPSQVVELRALCVSGRDGHTAAGWYDDFNLLAIHAEGVERRQPEGIYVTLNPVHEGCLARSPNALKDYQKTTTSDREIIARHWLPIDIDPARPAKISATKSELEAARERAGAIVNHLEGQLGWPRGLKAFSGNGIHLLYRVDLPVDDDTKDLIKSAIAAIARQFDTPAAKVDPTVFNAARIWKLWGTTARKGASTADRPHRRAVLWPWEGNHYPRFDEIQIVGYEQIEALIEAAPEDKSRREIEPRRRPVSTPDPDAVDAQRSRRPPPPRALEGVGAVPKDFDLDKFIADHGIQVARTESWDGTGVRHILNHCVFNPQHVGGSASLGRTPTGAIFYKCQHASCSSKRWLDCRRLFEPHKKGTRCGPGGPRRNKSEPGIVTDNPWDLSRMFLKENYAQKDGTLLIRHHRQIWYQYETRAECWKKVEDCDIDNEVVRWLSDRAEKVTRKMSGDVMACIKANVAVPAGYDIPLWADVRLGEDQPSCRVDPKPRNWLNLKNGIVDLDAIFADKEASECLQPATPHWLSLSKLDFDFDPTATCPKWTAFLDQIMEEDEDRIAILQEAFGYCLMNSAEYETFFIFCGDGSNGKSTVLNVLELMLGRPNISPLSMTELEHPFLRINLHGKLANICTDMDEIDAAGEKTLKKITSGETLIADRKYREKLEWKPRTKMFFATNVLPRFVDTTNGIWRRVCVVPFDFRIPEKDKDTKLINKLAKELPGILLWAMAGAARLQAQRKFTEALECRRAQQNYQRHCFPILTFLDEETVEEAESQVTMGALYAAYKEWCNTHGLSKPKPLHSFGKDVYSFRKGIKTVRTGRQERRTVVIGLRLKLEGELFEGTEQ